MSQMEVVDKEVEFHWGKKRGTGGAKKDIKFYESFTFDGIEYCLFDCVYLYSKDEVDPYIGKIVKIWEQPDGKRKVKILWLFLANEITTYLGDHETLENEIFLASGEGVGASNINPLGQHAYGLREVSARRPHASSTTLICMANHPMLSSKPSPPSIIEDEPGRLGGPDSSPPLPI